MTIENQRSENNLIFISGLPGIRLDPPVRNPFLTRMNSENNIRVPYING